MTVRRRRRCRCARSCRRALPRRACTARAPTRCARLRAARSACLRANGFEHMRQCRVVERRRRRREAHVRAPRTALDARSRARPTRRARSLRREREHQPERLRRDARRRLRAARWRAASRPSIVDAARIARGSRARAPRCCSSSGRIGDGASDSASALVSARVVSTDCLDQLHLLLDARADAGERALRGGIVGVDLAFEHVAPAMNRVERPAQIVRHHRQHVVAHEERGLGAQMRDALGRLRCLLVRAPRRRTARRSA